MTGQFHAPAVEHVQSMFPNQPFSSWLRKNTALFISQIAALLGLIYSLSSLIHYVTSAGEETSPFFSSKNVMVVVDYTHIVLIGLFIIVLIWHLDDNESGSYRVRLAYKRIFNEKASDLDIEDGKKRLKSFKRSFLGFWCLIWFLYVVFAWAHTYDLTHPPSAKSSHASQMTKMSFVDRSIWDVIAPGVGEEEAKPSTPAADNESAMFTDKIFEFLEFAFNNLSLWMVYCCFLALYLSPKVMVKSVAGGIVSGSELKARSAEIERIDAAIRLRKTMSFVIIASFTALFYWLIFSSSSVTTDNFRAYTAVFNAISGTMNAVVVALLIARLDSKLIGLPSQLICVLYSYAAVQPLFVAFQSEPGSHPVLDQITASVLVIVLVFKIYFFLIIMYSMQTGRMLNYLVSVPTLQSRADDEDAQPADSSSKEADPEPAFESALPRTSAPKPSKVVPTSPNRSDPSLGSAPTSASTTEIDTKTDQVADETDDNNPSTILDAVFRPNWLGREGVQTVSIWFGSLSLIVFLICFGWSVVSETLYRPSIIGWISHINYPGQLVAMAAMVALLLFMHIDENQHLDRVKATFTRIFGTNIVDSRFRSEQAEAHVKDFRIYFVYFWIATFLLYAALLLEPGFSVEFAQMPQYPLLRILFPFLKFGLACLNLGFIFCCFVVLQTPAHDERAVNRQKRLRHYAWFVVVLLIVTFALLASFAFGNGTDSDEILIGYATIFDGIAGMISAIAVALLIARFDSRLFKLKRPLKYILFTYAAIQPLFVVFEQKTEFFQSIAVVVLLAAFVLKVCFFLVIAHTIQSGKMLNYLLCFPFLRDRVDSIFENQYEIRTAKTGSEHSPFTFTILKKNQLVYTTDGHFTSHRDCDVAIEELRKKMANLDADVTPPVAEGTYWVEVPYHHNRFICESIPLKSEAECRHLIEESKQFIPHCKYDRV